jgi:hypothetical protein
MSDDLPRFRRRAYAQVRDFAARLLTNREDEHTTLRQLIERDNNAYRAVFEARYFVLADGAAEPSKSQWNSLKKRFKRAAPYVFLFKEHGAADCAEGETGCYYLDFGFFEDDRQPRR